VTITKIVNLHINTRIEKFTDSKMLSFSIYYEKK